MPLSSTTIHSAPGEGRSRCGSAALSPKEVSSLIDELREKELMIGTLRCQLERLNRSNRGSIHSRMSERSGSIISVGAAWIRRLARVGSRVSPMKPSQVLHDEQQSSQARSPSAVASKRSSRKSSIVSVEAIADESMMRQFEAFGPFIKGTTCAELPSGFMDVQKYTYQELMSPTVPVDTLMVDYLEWHLAEEDLLEYLSTCSEFLHDLDRSDLRDRKYQAMLTADQYVIYRKSLSTS